MSSVLPNSWALVSLQELATLITKGTTPTSLGFAYQDSGVRFVKVESLVDGRIDQSKCAWIGSDADAALSRSRLHPGDVLISIAGTIGRVGVVSVTDVPANTNQALAIVRLSSAATSKYVTAALNAFVSATKEGGKGVGLQNLNLQQIGELTLPIAPLPEQHRIVAKLDALQARSREAKEALDAIPPLLEKFRQSVLAAAFRGDLTRKWREAHPDVEPASVLLERIRAERKRRWEAEKPGKAPKEPSVAELESAYGDVASISWVVTQLEELVDPVRGIPYGIVQTSDPVVDGVPTVRCGDIKAFGIDVEALKRVAPTIHAQYPRTELQGGEVLIAIRGTVGATAVAGTNMVGMNISREVAMIPLLPAVVPRFVMYLLASPIAQSLVAAQVKGVAQSGINLGDLRELVVPLPGRQEQLAIVAAIDGAFERIEHIESAWAAVSQSRATLDQSILAKAFRGELVPQDPDDEPAEALLARVRAERHSDGRPLQRRGRR